MDNINIEKEQPNYYAIIPAAVRYDPTIPANAKLLYGEITALTNSKGYCWASNEYFAKLYDVDKKTISKWVQALIKNGHISAKMKFKNGTKQIEKRQIKTTTPIHPKVETLSTKKRIPPPPKDGDPIHKKVEDNNTSINNTINNTINNNESASTLFDSDFFNSIKDVWFRYHPAWKFQPKDGKGLKTIIEHFKKRQETAGGEVTPQSIATLFEFIINHQTVKGNTFLSTADPMTLASKLNSILEKINLSKHDKPISYNRAANEYACNPFI